MLLQHSAMPLILHLYVFSIGHNPARDSGVVSGVKTCSNVLFTIQTGNTSLYLWIVATRDGWTIAGDSHRVGISPHSDLLCGLRKGQNKGYFRCRSHP